MKLKKTRKYSKKINFLLEKYIFYITSLFNQFLYHGSIFQYIELKCKSPN